MSTFAKLFGSIVTSTVWGLSSDTCKVWITMLALADRDGIVEGSIPGLARVAVVSEDAVREALRLFLAPDPDSRTKKDEGRRIKEVVGGWLLINYVDHRQRASAEERRERDAERKRQKRAPKVGTPIEPESESVRVRPQASEQIRNVGHISDSAFASDPRSDSETDPDPDLGSEQGAGQENERSAVGEWIARGVFGRAERYVKDPTGAVMEWGPPERWPEVVEANEAFLSVYPNAGRLRPRDVRAPRIIERIAEGYSLEQLLKAAKGSRLDPHIGGNASFQTVGTVWRDAAQVDRFCALFDCPPKEDRHLSEADRVLNRQLEHIRELEAEEAAAASVEHGSAP